MRIKIGRIVNLDKDVNLLDLSPLDRVIASATNAYRNTSLYKRRYAVTEEKREEQRRKVRETLTNSLLAAISPELEGNKTLSGHGDNCVGALVKVPSRFNSLLAEVLESKDFDAYQTTVIRPTKLLSKFAEPATLVYFEIKGE